MTRWWSRKARPIVQRDSYHRFVGGTQPIFIGDDPESRRWPLRRAECSRCGEVRQMSWLVDPTAVRDKGCGEKP